MEKGWFGRGAEERGGKVVEGEDGGKAIVGI